jgi:hypothetical protein
MTDNNFGLITSQKKAIQKAQNVDGANKPHLDTIRSQTLEDLSPMNLQSQTNSYVT